MGRATEYDVFDQRFNENDSRYQRLYLSHCIHCEIVQKIIIAKKLKTYNQK